MSGNAGHERRTGPRCIAIVGPFASGKTSLLEEILFRTGATDKPGSVTAHNTVGDASPEARDHAMSVELNCATTEFMGEPYCFLDCPGSVEFGYEADPVLACVDAAIVVAEPDEKKIPALQVVMKHLEERNIPRLLFFNKIDKASGSVRDALEMLQPVSEVPLVLRQMPIWQDGIAVGFVDLALDRAFLYREHAPSEVVDMAEMDRLRYEEARFSMLESLADHDDALMEQLLEDIEPPRDAVFADLVTEMRAGEIVPVFLGSAANGNGIMRLLKALRHEAPDISDTQARLGIDAASGTLAQVMKTVHTTHGGKLSLARVLAGKMEDATELEGPHGAAKVSGIFKLMGQKATKRGAANAGETVALGKLESAQTGDTLLVKGTEAPRIVTPKPPQAVLQKVVQPSERKDEVKLSAALTKLVEEDPSLVVVHRQDTGETLVGGQGEMHLRVALERLAGKNGLAIETAAATVPYCETIRGSVTQRGRHKKQSGGHGQFGDVVLEIRPLGRGEGFAFADTISGGVVPKQYFSAVEAGAREALQNGPLGGFPVVDVGVTLTDGSYHSVDSSEQAFKMAAILAMREGLPQCDPVLLEPVMKVEIAVPSEATPKANAIVSGRRGQLMGFDARPGWEGWDVVEAMLPEAEIADLIIELRSATQGVGSFTFTFDHLAEVHGRLAEDILKGARQEAA
ncbi:elongation factor G [Afifella pfennigii]|uniref:elongation factor G n=1 Tax=Afifella pfennigii TaxID=209897 RepID=UPI00047C7CB7|nr:elongation factor G [Afifella pfennigii]